MLMMLADVSGVRRSEKGRLADANDADSCRGARVVFDQVSLPTLMAIVVFNSGDADDFDGAGIPYLGLWME